MLSLLCFLELLKKCFAMKLAKLIKTEPLKALGPCAKDAPQCADSTSQLDLAVRPRGGCVMASLLKPAKFDPNAAFCLNDLEYTVDPEKGFG